MKKNIIKVLGIMMALALVTTLVVPFTVNASNTGRVDTRVKTSEELQKESTVYAGEIFVNGQSQMHYLYSDDLSDEGTTYDNLQEGLNGTVFDGMVPQLERGHQPTGAKLAVSSLHQEDMNSNWKDASYVAGLYYAGKEQDKTNRNLYNVNSGYKNWIDNKNSQRSTEIDTPIDTGDRFLSVIKTSVEAKYEMHDTLVRVDYVTLGCEATTVVYTAVNIIPSSSYDFIEGDNQTYTKGTDGCARFRIDATFNLFQNGGKVFVDGSEVPSQYINAYTGSTVIEITKEFMDTLSEGEHTLKVLFNDDSTATTKFTIAKTSADASNTSTAGGTSAPSSPSTTKLTSSPKTSDNLSLWIGIIAVLTVATTGTVIYAKKRMK